MGRDEPRWLNLVFRAFFLLILPFFLGFLILPHGQAVSGQPVEPFPGNKSAPAGDFSFNFTHAQEAQSQFAQIESVFPPANYLSVYPLVSHRMTGICFQDVGSRIVLENGTTLYPDFYWEIRKPMSPPVMVRANSTACTNASRASPGDYSWAAQISTNLTREELGNNSVFYTDTRVRLQGEYEYGLLQGIAMIPAAYLFVWYPLFGIWRKIKEGMAAQ